MQRADRARDDCVRSQTWAIQPPTSVPAMPSMTVMAPTVRLAVPIDMPAKRRRNSGTHQEMPPMAKVSIARPKVAVRNAGLRKIPNTVARPKSALTWSLAPRCGSRPSHP